MISVASTRARPSRVVVAPRGRPRASRGRPRASSDDDAQTDVYVLVFDLDAPNESLYAVSSRRAGDLAPVNAFVCFDALRDALAAAVAVSERTRETPSAERAPLAAVALLAALAGYEVERVGAGRGFEVPDVVVEDAVDVDAETLTVSASALAKYLREGRAGTGAGETEDETANARARAARAMRDALLAPTSAARRAMRDALLAPARGVRDAAKTSASAPARGARTVVAGLGAAVRAFARSRPTSADSDSS